MSEKLQHIAIIMDGNNRWAQKHNLPLMIGHKQGAEAARRVIIGCAKLKIPYLTLYAFSSENWNRDPKEVEDLMTLLKIYLTNELDLLIKQKVRLKIIGDKNRFPSDILELINHCEEVTKDNDNLHLQLALSYSGRQEIIHAQKRLFSDFFSGKIKVEEFDEAEFKSYLHTSDIPDPDLLIRTSGEHRISNFLLWQIAYSELYFTKVLWPDFKTSHLNRAIANYYKRERRYGSRQIK